VLEFISNMESEKHSRLIPWNDLYKYGWVDAVVGEGIPVGPNDIIAYAPRMGSGSYFFLKVKSISGKKIIFANKVIRSIRKGREYKYKK